MSHLTMDVLVSLREPGNEPGQATAREHLNGCPHCQAELDRLHQRVARLKALPTLRPARDRWPETRARFKAERQRRRTRMVGFTGLAAAASVAAILTVGDLSRPNELTSEQLSQVMERSQVLEGALNEYNPEARVLDGRTARIAGELEDRIARLDRQLEMAELQQQQATDQDLLKLWRERVGLLDALVDVHVTRASNAGL
jgi:DNA repair exonuclease SbcCD ATPase subunit